MAYQHLPSTGSPTSIHIYTNIRLPVNGIPTPPFYWINNINFGDPVEVRVGMPLTCSLMFVYICIDVGDPVEGRC
jgi:hypothetical protein